MLSFSDSELDLVMAGAAQLPVESRIAFLCDCAVALAGSGDPQATVDRLLRAHQSLVLMNGCPSGDCRDDSELATLRPVRPRARA